MSCDKKILQHFHDTGQCPIRSILDRLGDKWSMLVMLTLEVNGTMRFGEILRSIGDISQRMLTVTLRTLETDGLISRTVYPEIPPKVEYRLTKRGESLMPHLQQLTDWAVTHAADIHRERQEADR